VRYVELTDDHLILLKTCHPERSEGPMHFAGRTDIACDCMDPSTRSNARQDDKTQGGLSIKNQQSSLGQVAHSSPVLA